MAQENIDELKRQIKELESKVAYLNAQLKEDNRFGLKWIDVPEAFDAESENKIPILEEVPELAITNNDGKPTHILIEGDNYHALTCLNYTHHGKVDVIYIDPPYNTGSDGFTYKDQRFLDKYPDGVKLPANHPLRHSAWLSFMQKRLKLAKELLSERGVIFISIDDNEMPNLKLLSDSIFGESNCIGVLPTIMNLKGNQDQFGFAGTHEYTIVYAKSKSLCTVGQLDIDEEGLENWIEDEIGYYKKGATLKRTGADAPREKRPYGYFPILIKNDTLEVSTITEDEYQMIYCPSNALFDDEYVSQLVDRYSAQGFSVLLPSIDGIQTSWRWGYRTVKSDSHEIIVTGQYGNFSLYKKQRPELGDIPTKKPKSVLYKAQYSSGNGTAQLKALSLWNLFNNPKPIDLIMDLLKIGGSKEITILDFFAGSGTTMHSTMQLNAEDGGHRQCILININENNICRDVTYERNKRVIEGYVTPKGLDVKGLGNSLKYYRTTFVGANDCSQATDNDRTVLAQKAGCLLALAENTLYEQNTTDNYQIFKDKDRDVWTAVYFKEDYRPKHFNEFVDAVKALKGTKNVYIFSWGDVGSFEAYFDDDSNVQIKGIPQPILDIYKSLNS